MEHFQPLSERNNRKEDWLSDAMITAAEEEGASCCSASTLKASNVMITMEEKVEKTEGSLIGLLQSLSDYRNDLLSILELVARGGLSRTTAEKIISSLIPSTQISVGEVFGYVEVLTDHPESWIRIREELETRQISTQEASEEQRRMSLDEVLSRPRPRSENTSKSSGEVSSLTNPSHGSPVRKGLPQHGTAGVATTPTSTVVGMQGDDSGAAVSLDSKADKNKNKNTQKQSPVRPGSNFTRNPRDDASFITTDRSPAGASTTATNGSSAAAALNTFGTADRSSAAGSSERNAILTVQNTTSMSNAVTPATNNSERDASMSTSAQNTAGMANTMCCLIL